MKHMSTQIKINATPMEVWDIFSKFHLHEHWNPFIMDIKGSINIGERIQIILYPNHRLLDDRMSTYKEFHKTPLGLHYKEGDYPIDLQKSSKFKVKIRLCNIGEKLHWEKKCLLFGNYYYGHTFTLEPLTNNCTLFKNEVAFKGFLVNMGWEAYTKYYYQAGLELMNEALKICVESGEMHLDENLIQYRS